MEEDNEGTYRASKHKGSSGWRGIGAIWRFVTSSVNLFEKTGRQESVCDSRGPLADSWEAGALLKSTEGATIFW